MQEVWLSRWKMNLKNNVAPHAVLDFFIWLWHLKAGGLSLGEWSLQNGAEKREEEMEKKGTNKDQNGALQQPKGDQSDPKFRQLQVWGSPGAPLGTQGAKEGTPRPF